jgi:protein-S-isoprenylcysteine O-methyltransferase Ste14
MRPLVFVWPYAPIFWLVLLWAFTPEFLIISRARQRAAQPTSKDDGSMRVIMLGQWIGMLLAFSFAFARPLRIATGAVLPIFCAGIATIVGASLLRRHCFRQLGEYFTGDVQARPDQPVINRGAYRWVRHPSYTAGILMFVGIGLALGNWASVFFLVLCSAAVYTYRIRVEERALIAEIGEPYLAYMRSRKRLVPFVL